MTNAPINLQDLRRRISEKAQAELIPTISLPQNVIPENNLTQIGDLGQFCLILDR